MVSLFTGMGRARRERRMRRPLLFFEAMPLRGLFETFEGVRLPTAPLCRERTGFTLFDADLRADALGG